MVVAEGEAKSVGFGPILPPPPSVWVAAAAGLRINEKLMRQKWMRRLLYFVMVMLDKGGGGGKDRLEKSEGRGAKAPALVFSRANLWRLFLDKRWI